MVSDREIDDTRERLMSARLEIGRLTREIEDLRMWVGDLRNRVIELENATGLHKRPDNGEGA